MGNVKGNTWFCNLRWAKRSDRECYLTRGWHKFCRANRLQEGSKVRFGAANNDPTKIYVAVLN